MIAAVMDPERIRACCQEALGEVLETMFFELPVSEPSGTAPPAATRSAVARFEGTLDDGNLEGRFRVAIEAPMLLRLAQDFLGLDEMELPGEAQTSNVLCELANMLCGSTLSRLDPEARLRISTPETAPLEPEPPPDAETRCDAERSAVSPWIDTPLECGALWVRVEVWETV